MRQRISGYLDFWPSTRLLQFAVIDTRSCRGYRRMLIQYEGGTNHGQGKWTYPDGSSYEGQWVEYCTATERWFLPMDEYISVIGSRGWLMGREL